MKFDLLIKGGEVVDAAAGYSGRMDVGIIDDRIAAVDRNIPADAAFRVIDASYQYVTPGLVDLHAHVFEKVTFWGVNADTVGSRSGVTTFVDPGSPGAMTIEGFRDWIVKPSRVRVYAFLNISAIGLVYHDYELANLAYCDVDLFKLMANQNRDLVKGVKARAGAATVGASGLEPFKRARQVADECELPLMIHIAQSPPTLEEVISFLKPGDVLTHCFTGQPMKIIDENQQLFDFVKRAWDKGVIFDIGHGAGSLSFTTAQALMDAGYRPDVISTDIHQVSIEGPMFDMPTCLSKFLHLGMTLPQVIEAATTRPAKVLRLEGQIGTLKPGALADIALFTLDEGNFPLYDIEGNILQAKHLLRNTLTIVGGRTLDRRAPEPPAPWMAWARAGADLPMQQFQAKLRERGHMPDVMAGERRKG